MHRFHPFPVRFNNWSDLAGDGGAAESSVKVTRVQRWRGEAWGGGPGRRAGGGDVGGAGSIH